MKNYSERALVINERIKELATYSDDEQGITRVFGTASFLACSNKIASWMRDAGLETRVDNIGNIRGKLKSKNPDAKTFVIGSHFDTAIHAGQYEGVLGILAGIELMENLISKNILFPFDIELIAFGDSEGIRFNCPYLGSMVVAGLFKNKYLHLKDKDGNRLSDILGSMNHDVERIKDDAIDPENLLGYFEIQIERNNVLSDQKIPVGVVHSILGEKRIEIDFIGKSGSAGIIPMDARNDALCAAAKFILSVEKYAAGEKRSLRATVGKIHVADSAANVIPRFVNCTLDIRSDDEHLLSDAYEIINSTCEKICDKRNIYFEWKLLEETDPVICNKKFRKLLLNCIGENKLPEVSLESGSDQSAAVIGKVAPVSILLVRSFKSNGRDPQEIVEVSDIATALQISDDFIRQLVSPERLLKKKEK